MPTAGYVLEPRPTTAVDDEDGERLALGANLWLGRTPLNNANPKPVEAFHVIKKQTNSL